MKNWRLIRLGVVLFTLVVAAGWVTEVSAAPAAPIDLVLTQPDGTTFSGRQWGDEWQNGVETDAGYTILQDGDGWWVYAKAAEDGTLSPALQTDAQRLVVGKTDPAGLSQHLRPAERNAPEPTIDGLYSQNNGTQPVLVLLVEFSDQKGTYPAASFSNLIFGSSNSVKDYYLDASFNQLTLAPANENQGTANDGVIGWLNLGYAHPDNGGNIDTPNAKIVSDALTMANPYIDYARYDTNGDGYISLNELHIVVIVAGYEASYNQSSHPNVWAHRWSLSQFQNNTDAPTLDGKTLCDPYHAGGYAQFGERHDDHQATIGVMIHELGHDLTWPDLYDTDDTSEGVGEWSIMGSGSWNYSSGYEGSSPALPDAWLKWYQGWITPTEVSGTLASASIPQAETENTAYLLRSNPNSVDWNYNVQSGVGEYFLVENRQKTGYDAGLPGCGLLVWHIDESVDYSNYANKNENHPLVKLVEADGQNDLYYAHNRGDAGDPFPGSANKRLFSFLTNPNSRLYSGADSLVKISSISACAATMIANLDYGTATTISNSFLPLVLNKFPKSLQNGNFEAGQDGSWAEHSSNGYSIILQPPSSTVAPHSGSWIAWLGGDNNEDSTLKQTNISLAGVRYLHYWYWINSNEYCGYNYDAATIFVNGTKLKSYDLCTSNQTGKWVEETLDLNGYAGQTISLLFEVETDGSSVSSLILDDISITASASASAPLASSLPTGLEGLSKAELQK